MTDIEFKLLLNNFPVDAICLGSLLKLFSPVLKSI